MHIRKHRKKWQCIVRCKGHVVIQSFESKSDARSWGEKTSSELRNGSYQNSDKLISMTLKDLLQLYLEKAMHKSKRPQILKYDVEMLRRFPIARTNRAHTLLSACVKLMHIEFINSESIDLYFLHLILFNYIIN